LKERKEWMYVSEMHNFLEAWNDLKKHLRKVEAEFKKEEFQQNIERIIELFKKAKSREMRVFLLGAGRDGDILKMFGTRLVQINFPRGQVKVVTEEGPFDLLMGSHSLAICLSGRGFTSPTTDIAKVLKDQGAELILITSNKKCELVKQKIPDVTLFIEGLTRFEFKLSRHAYGPDQTIRFGKKHPPPTLFEIAALCILECIISSLYFAQSTNK